MPRTGVNGTSTRRERNQNRLYKFFLDHDVLLRPLGNVIYVLPPYSIIREELDYVYEVIEEALEATAHK
jgi:adenosylmethionine-8-amino-7-oxononanoate aminotransferase